MFHYWSMVIPIVIFLPNFMFFAYPPRNMPAETGIQENWIYQMTEGIGRIGVLAAPIFSPIHIGNRTEIMATIGMIIFLALYYVGWVRYFIGNREFKLLFTPMMGIPVPLALSPILYFLCASIVLHSIFLLICSVILAIGHIPLSVKTYHKTV